MPPPIYQHVIDLVVNLNIRRGPGVFMKAIDSIVKQHSFKNVICVIKLSVCVYVWQQYRITQQKQKLKRLAIISGRIRDL